MMVMAESPRPKDTLPADPRRLRQARARKSSRASRRCCLRCPPALRTTGSASRSGWSTRRIRCTARVTVNRFWQMYFGTGLVKTVEDFGVQGEWPSHPELLDWLATEFIRTGWDVKAMQKLIVMSATYRQSSQGYAGIACSAIRRTACWRAVRGTGCPPRWSAIRRCTAAGLLVGEVGGPSVKPYQPEGLWKEQRCRTWITCQSKGADLYRRSLYTFWKRTIAPPMMMNFDAAGRESVRRARDSDQHAAAGAEPDERRHFHGGGAFHRPAHDEGGGRDADSRLRLWIPLVLGRKPSDGRAAFCAITSITTATTSQSDPDEAERYLSEGDPRRSGAEPARTGRLRVRRAA